MTVERGEVYFVDLPGSEDDDDDVEGDEWGLRHPGIVVQNNSENRTFDTTIIVPTTSGSAEEASGLTTVYIPSDGTCMDNDSIALCHQIRVVDVAERFGERMGELEEKKMREIERAIEVALAL